jgi:hypothetical protein
LNVPADLSPTSLHAQLERIQASEGFARSRNLSRFLQFVVEQSLAGRSEGLKEYLVGVEVFGRGDDFDPRIDPIVRVQAAKLRAKLASYYRSEGAGDPLVIELPKGGYVPVFVLRQDAGAALPTEVRDIEVAATRRVTVRRLFARGLMIAALAVTFISTLLVAKRIWQPAERARAIHSAAIPTCVTPPSNVVAWWPLDETSAPMTEDRAGKNPGTAGSAPTPAPGRVGGAMRFDGVDDFITIGDSDVFAFGQNDFTIELWANFDAPGSGDLIHAGDVFVAHDEGRGARNKWFFALGEGVLHLTVWDTDNPPDNPYLVRARFAPLLGRWYHLAVTRRGQAVTIFVDAKPLAVESFAGSIPNPKAPVTIGQAEKFGFMNGLLDEVSIYHRALGQGELQAIVDAAGAGKCKTPAT